MNITKSTLNYIDTMFPESHIKVFSMEIEEGKKFIFDEIEKITKSYIEVCLSSTLYYFILIFDDKLKEETLKQLLTANKIKFTSKNHDFRMKNFLNSIIDEENTKYHLIY